MCFTTFWAAFILDTSHHYSVFPLSNYVTVDPDLPEDALGYCFCFQDAHDPVSTWCFKSQRGTYSRIGGIYLQFFMKARNNLHNYQWYTFCGFLSS